MIWESILTAYKNSNTINFIWFIEIKWYIVASLQETTSLHKYWFFFIHYEHEDVVGTASVVPLLCPQLSDSIVK
jgi:hypothetical protein